MANPAGAIVLTRKVGTETEVYWVERSHSSAFLAGYRAFVGGRVEPGDAALARDHGFGEGAEACAAVAAVRELFEETGVLVARFPRPPGADRLERTLAELAEGRSFAEALSELGAKLDRELTRPAGRWLTPPFSARRFDTFFYLASLPEAQEARVRTSELAEGGWIRPAEAVRRWERAEVIMAPPVLHMLRCLAAGFDAGLEQRLLAIPEAHGEAGFRLEFYPGIVVVPLETDALPPTTRTNAIIVGRRDAVLVDPGSDRPDELRKLVGVLEASIARGVRPGRILLTHHHRDHVAGVAELRRRFPWPVAAHAETARLLADRQLTVDEEIGPGDRFELGEGYALTAHHTPGHAPGHLCFYEQRTGALLTGDNVISQGTSLVAPPEGDMDAFLSSLERMKGLDASALFGSHGPPLALPGRAIGQLIEHRLDRERLVLEAVEAGSRELHAIARAAYADTPKADPELARRQAAAHLVRLEAIGRIRHESGRYSPAH